MNFGQSKISLFDLVGGVCLFIMALLATVQGIRHFNQIPIIASIFFIIAILQGFCCYWNWKEALEK